MEKTYSSRSISKKVYDDALTELMKFKDSSPIANFTARECLNNLLDMMCIKIEEK